MGGPEPGAGDFLDGARRGDRGRRLLEVRRQPQGVWIGASTAPQRAVGIGGDVHGGAGQRNRLELTLAELVDGAVAVARPDLSLRSNRDLAERRRVHGDRREGAAIPLRQLLRIGLANREHRTVLAGGHGQRIARLLRPGRAVEIDDAAVDRGAPQAAGTTAGGVLQLRVPGCRPASSSRGDVVQLRAG